MECGASYRSLVSPCDQCSLLKFARCQHSLTASLAALPSMSRSPSAPFGNVTARRSHFAHLIARKVIPSLRSDCISLAPARLDRYLRGCAGHLAHPIDSFAPALSPSRVAHLCRGFPARSIRSIPSDQGPKTAKLECCLRGKPFASNNLHFIAKAIEFTQRGVEVRRDADTLEFFVDDRHGDDVVFVEKIFPHGVRIGAVGVNISDCTRLVWIERSIEPNFGHLFEPVHPVTGQVT